MIECGCGMVVGMAVVVNCSGRVEIRAFEVGGELDVRWQVRVCGEWEEFWQVDRGCF